MTHTPNRFITSIQSWPGKGLALFLILIALASCEEDLGLIGSKKPVSRFGVYFKEFDIPVTTVQADSINSSAIVSERLLCGNASDPNFGKVTATTALSLILIFIAELLFPRQGKVRTNAAM